MDDYDIGLKTPRCVYYDADFLTTEEANTAYQELLHSTKWEKTSKINRYVALLHDIENDDDDNNNDTTYKYRDAPDADNNNSNGNQRRPFTETIRRICDKAETWYNSKRIKDQNDNSAPDNATVKFNVCLLNFYENGSQRIGWHCDREEIGRTTPIASISLGATREFHLRAKEGLEKASLSLANGSLVIMENQCQLDYLHCLPKMNHVQEGRINLTFRCKQARTAGEDEHERRDKWLERITDIREGDNDKASFGQSYPNQSLALQQEHGQDNTGHVFGDIVETEEELQSKLETMKVVFTAKTNIGAEGYAAAEIEQVLQTLKADIGEAWTTVPRPWGAAGYVAIGIASETTTNNDNDDNKNHQVKVLSSELLRLRSCFHIMQYHDHFDLQDVAQHAKLNDTSQVGGEELYQFYKQRLVDATATIPTLMEQQQQQTDHADNSNNKQNKQNKQKKLTFRVTCERIGERHNFQAPQVEFELGGAMSEYYSDTAKPKMQDYDVHVRADVIGTVVMVGTQNNLVDLSRRNSYYRFRNKVTLKTNLAYCMLRCANLKAYDTVLDPFCGSGTILLEAYEMEPTVQCIGMDVNRRSVEGARENAEALVGTNDGGSANQFEFYCVDVRAFRKHIPNECSIDCIVTNLPWGVQTGHKKSVTDLQSLYEMFLRTAWYTLKPHGRIVMLVLRGLQLTRIVRKLGGRYRILRANVVKTSNNLPCLVVVEKLPRDVLNETVKGQLAYLSQFVSVSREMYQAIHHEDIADGIDVPEPKRTNGGGATSSSPQQGDDDE